MKILVIGDAHLLPKTLRYYDILKKQFGIEGYFYTNDSTGLTRMMQGNAENIFYAREHKYRLLAWLFHLIGYIGLLRRLRPDIIEIYSGRHPLLLLAMARYAKLMHLPVVVICRGELYYWEKKQNVKRASFLVRWSFNRILRLADLVVYKETYMPRLLKQICPRTPRYFWHNGVPLGPEPPLERQEDIVLFLNFFKPWRNIDLLIKAAGLVRSRVPSATFLLVGKGSHLAASRNRNNDIQEYEDGLERAIDDAGLRGTMVTLPFADQPSSFYAKAKVYVLPADLIYCNNALLEAMERGVPPVVSDEKDPDARLIVEDGVSGLVVPLNEHALADAIIKLLVDEEYRLRLARGARLKIAEEYDLSKCLERMAEQYRRLNNMKKPLARPDYFHPDTANTENIDNAYATTE
jgi:glycosyltransferase involved in cell wall biosynthesis